MHEKRWELWERKKIGIKDQLLLNRGLAEEYDRERFFHSHLNQLENPDNIFPDLTKALEQIQKSIKSEELIYVYGDYDVDGITATAILWETLALLGARVMPYIPSRHNEGYGLNSSALKSLASQGARLIISVDCGITAVKQAREAKKLGLSLIITDHHQLREKTPEASAILHTTSLSGSGIAFWLAKALLEEYGYSEEQFSRNLELAALGTVADMVPLTASNRIIVRNGLVSLASTQRPGLVSLYNQAGLGRKIGTFEIGYIIAPRLNASGRMSDALDSLRLLLTRKRERAELLAEKLESINRKRQDATTFAFGHSKEVVEKQFKAAKMLILSSTDYEEGVVGLVAGRLVEEYYRPTAVISEMEKVSKGSGRSIRGFNITDAIGQSAHLLLSHGGHPMAAGFSLERGQIPFFREAMLKIAEDTLKKEDLQPVLRIDSEIESGQINLELMGVVKEFEPFGVGNPEPVFLLKGVDVADIRTLGKEGKHLRFILKKAGKIFEGVGFNLASKRPKTDSNIDVVFNLRENVWNSRKRLELRIVDLKTSGQAG